MQEIIKQIDDFIDSLNTKKFFDISEKNQIDQHRNELRRMIIDKSAGNIDSLKYLTDYLTDKWSGLQVAYLNDENKILMELMPGKVMSVDKFNKKLNL